MLTLDVDKGIANRDGKLIELTRTQARVLAWILRCSRSGDFCVPLDSHSALGITRQCLHKHVQHINHSLGPPRAINHRAGYGYQVHQSDL